MVWHALWWEENAPGGQHRPLSDPKRRLRLPSATEAWRECTAWELVEDDQGDCEHELPARSTSPSGQSHWLQPRSEPEREGSSRSAGPGPRLPAPTPGLAPLSGGGERESRARFCKSKAGRRSSDTSAFAGSPGVFVSTV